MAIKWGARSQGNISQLHGSLQRLLYEVADQFPPSLDLTITDSFRGEAEQNKAFAAGNSKKRWPDSAHNKQPARAFDFVNASSGFKPYDRDQMLMRQGAIRLLASKLNIGLKPLIDWDTPHVEMADAE